MAVLFLAETNRDAIVLRILLIFLREVARLKLTVGVGAGVSVFVAGAGAIVLAATAF